MTSLTKDRIDGLKFMRVVAMLLVVLIHGTDIALKTVPSESPIYFLYLFFNRFTRFEGEVFVFLSGVTLFYNYADRPFTKKTWLNFYKRRFMFILFPFLIFSIFYELYSYYLGIRYYTGILPMIQSIITGKAFYQLYFILILVQLYFLFPLFIYIVRKSNWVKKYLFVIGFLLEWLLQVLFVHYNIQTSVHLFTVYIGAFFFGGWVAIYYNNLKQEWSNKKLIAAICLTAILGLIYMFEFYYRNVLGYTNIPYLPFKFINILYFFSACFVLFKLSITLANKGGKWLNDTAERLRIYSFGFYLVHPFFLTEWEKILVANNELLFHAFIFIRYILVLLCCYWFIRVIHLVFPKAWFLFGNLPKPEIQPSIKYKFLKK